MYHDAIIALTAFVGMALGQWIAFLFFVLRHKLPKEESVAKKINRNPHPETMEVGKRYSVSFRSITDAITSLTGVLSVSQV